MTSKAEHSPFSDFPFSPSLFYSPGQNVHYHFRGAGFFPKAPIPPRLILFTHVVVGQGLKLSLLTENECPQIVAGGLSFLFFLPSRKGRVIAAVSRPFKRGFPQLPPLSFLPPFCSKGRKISMVTVLSPDAGRTNFWKRQEKRRRGAPQIGKSPLLRKFRNPGPHSTRGKYCITLSGVLQNMRDSQTRWGKIDIPSAR